MLVSRRQGRINKLDDPADVAKIGFEAMMAGKDKVIAAKPGSAKKH